MKRNTSPLLVLVIIPLLFCANFTFSQNQIWPKKGATWIYQNDLFIKLLLKFKYTKDTLINGVNCQQISVEKKEQYEPTDAVVYSKRNFYSKCVGDSVFLAFSDSTNFEFIFDFSTSKNTKWLRENEKFSSCSDTSITRIDSLSTKLINGKNLQVIYLHSELNAANKQGGMIYDRLGQYNNGVCEMFYPYNGECSGVIDWYDFVLLSYKDDEWSFIPNGVNGEEVFNTLSLKAMKGLSFSVYPNPVKEILHIDYQGSDNEFNVINSLGTKMNINPIKSFQQTVEWDVSHYPEGIYFIQNRETGEVIQWVKL